MKTSILAILFCLAFAVTAAAYELQINYSDTGSTSVRIDKRNRLHFEWHTARIDTPLSPQSLAGDDRHSCAIWLTKSEKDAFRYWVRANHIFRLKSKYPEKEKRTYGINFRSVLIVEIDGKKHGVSWSDKSKIPNSLRKAVNKLIELSHKIRKRREGV